MGQLDGKVAFITGAARGQGRSHAIRLAEEGADIIAIDICDDIASVGYPLSTPEDLAITVKEVEALGRRIIATQADTRDFDAVKAAVDNGVAKLGRLDIVSANAGVGGFNTLVDMSHQQWQDVIDVNLTGTFFTLKASVPHLQAAGGGSIIITSSTIGLKGGPNLAHYAASKHAQVGLMRTAALELAPDHIRVNTIHPTSVDTDCIQNPMTYALFAPDLPASERTKEVLAPRFQGLNALPTPWLDARDISEAVLFLASDSARYITGVAMPIDAGLLSK